MGVMWRHKKLAGTVHADAWEILLEIENILDDDFSLVVQGQPECKREQFKERYPLFRQKLADNGGPPPNSPNANILNPLVDLLFQTSRLSGKLFRLVRFIIPSARPEIPFASALAMIGYNVEKVLWEQAVVVPIGGDRDAPNLGAQTAGFSNEKNLKGIQEYGAAWASGNMERLLSVLAPDFTLTLDGEPSAITRDAVAAFYKTSRKRLEERGGADYRKIRKITAKEVGDITLVGEEYEDIASNTVSLYAFQNGLCFAATSSIKPKDGPCIVTETTEDRKP